MKGRTKGSHTIADRDGTEASSFRAQREDWLRRREMSQEVAARETPARRGLPRGPGPVACGTRSRRAGNPRFLTSGLLDTLADHAECNHRTLMTHPDEWLLAGAEREVTQLDEQLFFDLFARCRPSDHARCGLGARDDPSCRWFARASCPSVPASARRRMSTIFVIAPSSTSCDQSRSLHARPEASSASTAPAVPEPTVVSRR
jgi:hypothetical protein